ncbi:hypothetical protein [uncultured Microbulbifer sp.]|uniref:hypothetical protein n=1 Tax=uncultured Microbulbifer sp. TaxID=348147 RepID=UPI002629A1A7|nr:hypothetical protein [uncultured Microbulbifer sp.]
MSKALRSMLAIAVSAVSFGTIAATNPDAATANESEGDFTITMGLAPYIVVNHFNDLALTVDPAVGATGQEDICVGGYGFPDYSISFSSANSSTGMPFALKGDSTGSTDFVPYSVEFADSVTASTGDSVLADGTTGTGVRYARTATVTDCLDTATDNARIFIAVDANDWQGVSEQSFTDTLTVTVSAI